MSITDQIADARNEQELHWIEVKLSMLEHRVQTKTIERARNAIALRRQEILKNPPVQRPVHNLPDSGFVPQEYPEILEDALEEILV
jgi:hypothetical protein